MGWDGRTGLSRSLGRDNILKEKLWAIVFVNCVYNWMIKMSCRKEGGEKKL